MKIHNHDRLSINSPLHTNAPFPSIDSNTPLSLIAKCPDYKTTALVKCQFAGIDAEFYIKDERRRMGMGSFKALGAAYVIASMAQKKDISEITFVSSSAGNHGLSIAAGAKTFGAKAVIFLSNTVPEAFADKLVALDATVIRAGANYEESFEAACVAAEEHGWSLLSDTSWDGYVDLPWQLMEGYLVMAAEVADQIEQPPTHIFLQAGVGGMAGACAAYFRKIWGDFPQIIVVEPTRAPALFEAVKLGKMVKTSGEVSNMGRLDCKEASLIALNGLSRDADSFILLDDDEVHAQLELLRQYDLDTSPSGGAGLAAALRCAGDFAKDARILCIISEAA